MKNPNHTAKLYKTLALTGMLLFISYYGYGQQALEMSFEPDERYEIVINRMPSLSAELFGKDFVYYTISIGQMGLAVFHSYLKSKSEEDKGFGARIRH